jgi:hypothetical protein
VPKRFDRGLNHSIPSQRWVTFVCNHAKAIVSCDFRTVVTATFRLLYVFVLMEHATRRILHCNVTVHPTAQWTIQQLRDAMLADHGYRWRVMERSMRTHVETTGTGLTGWQKKATDRPTAFMMVTKFAGVIVLKVGQRRRLARPLSTVHRGYLAA